jgi:hypothetical protein
LSEDEARGLRAWGELLGWLAKREGTDSIEKLTPVAVDFYTELVAGAEFMRQHGEQRKDGDLTGGGRGSV